jgi:hypothetical protein
MPPLRPENGNLWEKGKTQSIACCRFLVRIRVRPERQKPGTKRIPASCQPTWVRAWNCSSLISCLFRAKASLGYRAQPGSDIIRRLVIDPRGLSDSRGFHSTASLAGNRDNWGTAREWSADASRAPRRTSRHHPRSEVCDGRSSLHGARKPVEPMVGS